MTRLAINPRFLKTIDYYETDFHDEIGSQIAYFKIKLFYRKKRKFLSFEWEVEKKIVLDFISPKGDDGKFAPPSLYTDTINYLSEYFMKV